MTTSSTFAPLLLYQALHLSLTFPVPLTLFIDFLFHFCHPTLSAPFFPLPALAVPFFLVLFFFPFLSPLCRSFVVLFLLDLFLYLILSMSEFVFFDILLCLFVLFIFTFSFLNISFFSSSYFSSPSPPCFSPTLLPCCPGNTAI